MDRSKSSSNLRGAKGKITQHPPDLFALGSKPTSSRDTEVKRSASTHSKLPSSSHSSLPSIHSKDRKREGVAPSLPVIPTKKPKVFPIPAPSRSTATLPTSSERFATTNAPPTNEQWENKAIDSDEGDLVANVLNAVADGDTDRGIGYLLGGLKLLRSQKYKPELMLITAIGYIAKQKPSLFRNDDVTQAVFSLLRRDSVSSFKSKGNPQVPTFAVNLLMRGYEEITNWPKSFFKYYLEDALGDRVWVDHELCTPFVDNIQSAFNTKTPPKSLLQPELSSIGNRGDTGSPLTINEDDSGDFSNGRKKNILEKYNIATHARYANCLEYVEQTVLEAAKEHILRKQPPETVTKNFLRFLATACGLVEIRMLAISKIEMWLHNAKLMRFAQDLLVYLCYNSVAETQRDIEVISLLTKIRFKTKALVNVFLNCLRDMIASHEENLPVILKHTIYNELSNARNPNNMIMIGVIFQTSCEHAANVLAEIFLELLLNKDDYLRPLRTLLREIARALRYDIDMYIFCRALIRERKETTNTLREFEFKDRMFNSVVDIICLCMFLAAVSPSVKEAANYLSRGDKKELHTLQKFQKQISQIQSDSLWWLHETAIRMYRPSGPDFIASLRKLLLLEPIENYCKQDMWPSENERNILMRLCTEVPLLQGTLIRILLIGISKDHPLLQMETLDFCDPLIKRAAMQSTEYTVMLQFDKLEIIDLIFNLCTYHHPENITLPVGYTPPQLAISNLYWKGWIILLILAAHNPTTFGSVAWEKYPTLRIFMEMCITNHFSYPPPTMAMCENYEELKSKELQIAALEKQQILEFESHLAAASKITINETNSLLLPQLITMAPMGVSRRPPPTILEQLRSLNASHRLGHLLCRSRRPDFLLDIIQRQGPSQHMPWLAELVQNSEGALSHLPVQCLCEFLLSSGLNLGEKSDRIFRQKHIQLVNHLHTLLTSENHSPASACEVLEYFLRRLSSPHYTSRVQAIKGIKLVLQSHEDAVDSMEVDNVENEGEVWLLRQLAQMPHFDAVRPQIIVALRQACQVENDPNMISSYIQFLEHHSCMDSYPEMAELVYDMAQLIVERSTIIAAILPTPDEVNPTAERSLSSCVVIYSAFLQKALQINREAIQWAECTEQVLIQWSNGEECIIQLLVIHAIIILLTYGPVSDSEELYKKMLDQWFPLNEEPPKAYSIETSEQLLYIPDWLKLRMIRSNVPRLVDAALVGLEQSKLMLFVQSFGIPIPSMSKLLHALDVAVTEDEMAVAEAVLDKTYMAQLVEVQRRRGAVGGDIFVEALNLHEPPTADDNRIQFLYWRKPLPTNIETMTSSSQILHAQCIPSLLNAIFFKTEYTGDVNIDFRTLLKILTSEITNKHSNSVVALNIVVTFFITNCKSKPFANVLLENCSSTTRLLRLFLSNSQAEHIPPGFIEALRIICRNLKDQKNSSLTFFLTHFIKKHTNESDNMAMVKFEDPKIFDLDPNKVLRNADALTLEKMGRKMLEQGVHVHNNAVLIEAIAQRLIDIKNERHLNFNPGGLLVDWLASIEPELIGSSPDLQMDLMFSTNRSNSYRAYLQTLLVHRANWGTLHRCIGHLLADCNSRYDPTAVLDFLWALSRNPKLLQGRDKNIPKNVKAEDMLELSQLELKSLVNYMLEESFLIEKSQQTSSQNISASANCTELRIPLLLQCIYENPIAINYVARYLLFIIKAEEQKYINNKVETIIILDDTNQWYTENEQNGKFLRKKIAEQLLLLLYMHVPRIIHHISGCDRDKIFKKIYLTEWSSSSLDKISHCLLTALAATPHMKDWGKRSQDYEIMTRKMCATHPVLILRQLQMIAASLRGRAHLDFGVFRSRNHLNLFTQVLGIVELLQPYIYMPEHQVGLENTLNEFFTLFKSHGRVKDLIPLLNRFISILQTYINYDAKKALKFLQKHAHLLNDLQMYHTNLNSLRDLMTGILLPRGDSDLTDQDGGDVLVAVIPPVAQEQLPSNWDQLVINLTKLQGDDVYTALQDIEHLSNRKPSILESILSELCRLMMSPTVGIRVLAHTLVTRHLKHNPTDDSITSTVFTATLRCLDSSNTDIVVTTLERLPELIVCMQENAIPILEKVFTLGIGSDINTASYINKVINLLNLQIGC